MVISIRLPKCVVYFISRSLATSVKFSAVITPAMFSVPLVPPTPWLLCTPKLSPDHIPVLLKAVVMLEIFSVMTFVKFSVFLTSFSFPNRLSAA